MKKSIKKYLKEGSIIKTEDNIFYEIVFLNETSFTCRLLNRDVDDKIDILQEFYYKIVLLRTL